MRDTRSQEVETRNFYRFCHRLESRDNTVQGLTFVTKSSHTMSIPTLRYSRIIFFFKVLELHTYASALKSTCNNRSNCYTISEAIYLQMHLYWTTVTLHQLSAENHKLMCPSIIDELKIAACNNNRMISSGL